MIREPGGWTDRALRFSVELPVYTRDITKMHRTRARPAPPFNVGWVEATKTFEHAFLPNIEWGAGGNDIGGSLVLFCRRAYLVCPDRSAKLGDLVVQYEPCGGFRAEIRQASGEMGWLRVVL